MAAHRVKMQATINPARQCIQSLKPESMHILKIREKKLIWNRYCCDNIVDTKLKQHNKHKNKQTNTLWISIRKRDGVSSFLVIYLVVFSFLK